MKNTKETDWKTLWTLDEVAECLEVSDSTYDILWSLMTETDSNLMSDHWSNLTSSVQAEITHAHQTNY